MCQDRRGQARPKKTLFEHFFGGQLQLQLELHPSQVRHIEGKLDGAMLRCVGRAEVDLGRCSTPGQTHQLHQGLADALDFIKSRSFKVPVRGSSQTDNGIRRVLFFRRLP